MVSPPALVQPFLSPLSVPSQPCPRGLHWASAYSWLCRAAPPSQVPPFTGAPCTAACCPGVAHTQIAPEIPIPRFHGLESIAFGWKRRKIQAGFLKNLIYDNNLPIPCAQPCSLWARPPSVTFPTSVLGPGSFFSQVVLYF